MKAIPSRPGFFTTYYDSVGVLTLGFGHTNAAGGIQISRGDVWTREQCDAALTQDLTAVENTVTRIMGPLSQNFFDALVDFEFNTGKLAASTIPAKLKAGNNAAAIATLLEYNHAGGEVLAGLTRRRNCNAAMMQNNIELAQKIADIHTTAQTGG